MSPLSSLPIDVSAFLKGKPSRSVELFLHLHDFLADAGGNEMETTKTTIAFGIERRYCYVYQFGKDFISGVLKLDELHDDREIFFKTGKVSGSSYSHHFRLYEKKDLSKGLKKYLKMAMKR